MQVTRGVDGIDIDMGDTGITSVGVSGRPAHQFDAVIAQFGGCPENGLERCVRQDGADKAQGKDRGHVEEPSLLYAGQCGQIRELTNWKLVVCVAA